MLNAGVPTFQEFAMRETLPLATIHESVLEFLKGRSDVVLFGAQAVNAYVSERVAFAVSRIERKSFGNFAGEKCRRIGFGNLGEDCE